jgi:proteasome activator subunit 4
VFRLWYGLNSGLWDDQASDLMGQLAIAHVDPGRSDPSLIGKIPRAQFNTAEEESKNPNHIRIARGHKSRLLDVAGDVIEDDDGFNYWSDPAKMPEEPRLADPNWQGIRKDIGIFTEQEFEFLMSKCLRSLSEYLSWNYSAHPQMYLSEAVLHHQMPCR